ncbi:MAG: ATP-binding cassette domain-containing protein [Bacteroidia bacterium]|nr:ATP-binding cassette domain-containing protein [Bacteroidia bacterium]
MLHIENAGICFNQEVLFSGVNLRLGRGEMACISGQSGRGKTSLLNAIMGFVPLKTGQITVNNILLNQTSIDEIRKQIAWIPQELSIPLEWVKEMVNLPFTLKANRQCEFSEQQLFNLFEQLGLEPELYAKRVNEISGGQRQRIMIAVAAMLNKPLIIIDEPTSALDAGSAFKVLTFLQCEAQKGKTVLIVSHDKKMAAGCHLYIEL